jgi:hypothetical protein
MLDPDPYPINTDPKHWPVVGRSHWHLLFLSERKFKLVFVYIFIFGSFTALSISLVIRDEYDRLQLQEGIFLPSELAERLLHQVQARDFSISELARRGDFSDFSDPDLAPDPAIFVNDLFLLITILFEATLVHLYHFSKIKSHKEVSKQELRFFLLFLFDYRRIRRRIQEAQKHTDPPDLQHCFFLYCFHHCFIRRP